METGGRRRRAESEQLGFQIVAGVFFPWKGAEEGAPLPPTRRLWPIRARNLLKMSKVLLMKEEEIWKRK